MPIELAHGVQVVQMCQAFAENNCEVELLIPRRINPIKESSFSYYSVKRIFSIKKIPCLDLIFLSGKNIFFWIQTFTFLLFTKIYLSFKKYDILYTREQAVGLFFKDFVLEVHSLPGKIKPFHKKVWRRAKLLVVLTRFIKEKMIAAGVPSDKILVSPDGVDLEKFDIDLSKENAREKLNLPQNKKLIGYVGMLRTLGMEKGIDTALNAFSSLNFSDAVLVLVGGHQGDIDFYKDAADKLGVADKIIFIGKVPHAEVPVYLKAFDLLLAPFPSNEHYSYYMSPLKIFEYMASKRPIIATDLPSLKEILTDSALLVGPGNADNLKTGISEIFDNKELAESLAEKAFKEVSEKYAWRKRAQNILNEINN
jgi:glycosyltransferase involved in cell wall biosynthesis